MPIVLSVGDSIRDGEYNEYRLDRIEKHPSGILSDDLIFTNAESEGIEYRMPEPMVNLLIEKGTYEVLGAAFRDQMIGDVIEHQFNVDCHVWTVRRLNEISYTVLAELHACILAAQANEIDNI